MELAHELLYTLCLVLDMLATFQAMVSAHFKLAMIGLFAFVCVVLVGCAIYFSEEKRK